jgi:hypothetical protein
MAIDASEAGHRLAKLHGDYLFETGLEPDLEGAQRIYVMLWRCQAELYNGGIWQFFTNTNGMYDPHICDALRVVGAHEMVPTMEEAIASSRPGTPWHSAASRSAALYSAPEDVRTRVHELDDRFGPSLDGLSVKLFDFVSLHRDEFDVSKELWEEGRLP